MIENFEAKFGFLNLVSKKILHHAVLLPRIYSIENCKLLLHYLAWSGEKSVEEILSSPDNLFFTKFSEHEVPLKVGDKDNWHDGARLIIKFAQKTGFSAKKIIVIDEIDNATPQALNALLKILEEPPQNTQFFLIYKDIKSVLETICSRCLIVREEINTLEKFETMADFFGFTKNYNNFILSGFDFDCYQLKHDKNISTILEKLCQYSVDDGFIQNSMAQLERFLHEKFLKAKNIFDIQKISQIQERLNTLKKACEILNTNKYTSLVELTEEIHALDI